jgi:hypothetical protein
MDGSIMTAGLDGYFAFAEGSRSWKQVYQYDADNILLHPSGILLGSAWPGVLRSTDLGGTWQSTALGSLQGSIVLQNSSGVCYTGIVDSSIYRSYDAGASWSQGNCRLQRARVVDGAIQNDGTLLLLCDRVGLLRIDSSLTNVGQPLPYTTSGDVTSLAIEAGGAVLVAAANGVFRSTDNGTTWRTLASPNPGHATPWRIAVNRKGTIFCVFRLYDNPQDFRTYRGMELYSTTYLGSTWQAMDPPQPYQWYTLLKILPDDKLYISSRTEGLFRSREAVLSTGGDTAPRLPASAALAVWPQPADRTVTLSWSDPDHMRTLLVHDLMGRIVDRLEITESVTDEKRIVYDTGTLPAGMYVLTMVGEQNVLRTRLLIAPKR